MQGGMPFPGTKLCTARQTSEILTAAMCPRFDLSTSVHHSVLKLKAIQACSEYLAHLEAI